MNTNQIAMIHMSGLRPEIAEYVKRLKIIRGLRKKVAKQISRTVKTVKFTKWVKKRGKSLKKARSSKQSPTIKEVKTYRRIVRSFSKKGKHQSEKVWRSVEHYSLKDGETWTDLWAYDTKRPTKRTHTFWFPLKLEDKISA